ncbi:MAG: histidine kinase [Lachnospiraceae bacterium]|nr:histidine kinase [Lachnospiraceae bacterium]
MRSFYNRLSVQNRVILTCIVTSILISLVNLYLFFNINQVIARMGELYHTNVVLEELSEGLSSVQGSLTEFLNTKSSDAMEDYFRNAQSYQGLLEGLDFTGTAPDTAILGENIRNLSDSYLAYADAAVQARRGHIIERYMNDYASASGTFDAINDYLYRLNLEQFSINTDNYNSLVGSFRFLELISVIVLFMLSAVNIALIAAFTKNIMDPVRERELRMEAHIREAELKYLEAQIDPHFLFNTLNAGAQLAMMEDAEKTSDYIQRMAAFYRYKIHGGNAESTLEKEIELVDNYIYILNVRFSGSIRFEKHCEEELLPVKIPDMVLQPIVENAVNHGIRNVEYPGCIVLTVTGEGDNVLLSVSDNGVGMSAERIAEVMSGRAGADEGKLTNGVGLHNVISRLELFYGKSDIMKLESAGEGCGTTVSLLLPRRMAEG